MRLGRTTPAEVMVTFLERGFKSFTYAWVEARSSDVRLFGHDCHVFKHVWLFYRNWQPGWGVHAPGTMIFGKCGQTLSRVSYLAIKGVLEICCFMGLRLHFPQGPLISAP